MSSVSKARRRDGRVFWRAVWSVTVDGKRRQMTKSFATAAAAKQFAAQMSDHERRGVADVNRHTVRSYLAHWIGQIEKRGQHSITTLIGYRRCIEFACRHLGDVPLRKLTPRDVDSAYTDLLDHGGKTQRRDSDGNRMPRALAPQTVVHVHRCLSTALRQAVKWRLIAENPCALASPPSVPLGKVRAMTAMDASRVMRRAATPSGRTYPGLDVLAATLLITGMRRSEAAGLSWDCVRLEEKQIDVRRVIVTGEGNVPVLRELTKTKSSHRTIIIPDELVVMLKRQRTFIAEQMLAFGKDYQRDPLLCFPEAGGVPMKPDTLTSRLRSLLRAAKVENVSPVHSARHTMASQLIRTTDLATVSRRLGHSTPATTARIYLHGDEERDHAAADVLGETLKAWNNSGT